MARSRGLLGRFRRADLVGRRPDHIAIATWAQAPHGRGCGGLTQGPLLHTREGWEPRKEAQRRLASRS